MDKYRTYEIYCEEFSEVIQAETLLQAVNQFEVNNPSYNVIFAEDAEFRKKEETKAILKEVEPLNVEEWISVDFSVPSKEGYYDVKFDDGTEDEKPYRIRMNKQIHGFMTEDNIRYWRKLTDKPQPEID